VDNVGLFFACFFCHGELALRKPAARYPTHLSHARGRGRSAVSLSVVAPVILPGHFELCLMLVAALRARDSDRAPPSASERSLGSLLSFAGVLSLFMTVFYGMAYFQYMRQNTILMRRNFTDRSS
jgi:hypothetical protein